MALTKVTSNVMADDAITSAMIAPGAIDNTHITGITTTDITEGTNQYYTDGKVGTYLNVNGYDTATNIISAITDTAPITLDTLNELAAALGDDPNFATTVTNSIATKLPLAGGTLTGALTGTTATFSGEITANGGIALGDGDVATFGASDDLQIYHDGSHSYISEVGTGELVIQARDAVTIEDGTSGDNYIYMQRGNKVSLFYAGAEKLATTATGIDVTGDVNTSGLIKVGVNDTEYANNYIRFKPTGAAYIDHNTVGQDINFRLSNASSLDKTPLVISPTGINVTGTVTADALTVSGYAQLTGVGSEAASRFTINNDGSGTGHLQFQTAQNSQGNGYVRANIVMARNRDTIVWNNVNSTWDYTSGSSAAWSMISKTSGSMNFYIGDSTGVDWSLSNADFNANYLMHYFNYNAGHTWEAPGGGGFVFNESGADRDFRVESTGNANMFVVDAGNSSVGIGTNATGSTALVVQASAGAGAISIIGRAAGGVGTLSFYDDDGSTSVGYIQGRADDNQLRVWGTQSGGNVSFAQNNTERLKITEYGGVHSRNGHLGTSYTGIDGPDRANWTVSTFSDNAHVTSGYISIYTANTEWQPNLIRVVATSVDSDLTDTGNAVWYIRVSSYHGAGSGISAVDSWTSGNMSISVTATDINEHHMRVNITVTGSGNRTVCAAESLSYGGVFETARTG